MRRTILLTISFLLICAIENTSFAKVYYVAKNGSDSRTATQAQNITTPKLTIASGLTCLSAGDTLYIRSGVYAETLNQNMIAIPSGISWSKPVTVAGYPGETVTIRPNTGVDEVIRLMGTAGGAKYLIFDNLHLDGINIADNVVKITYTGSDPSYTANHIMFKNSEIFNAPNQGVFVDHNSVGNQFINLQVHNNGTTDFHHGLYITGANNLVDGCDIHHNAGWGVHVYSDTGIAVDSNIVRNNSIHDNAYAGGRGCGIILSCGKGNMAYNNLIWNNNGGVQIDVAVNTCVYNNTIYSNNAGSGGYAGVKIQSGSTGAKIENNICWQNNAGAIENMGSSTTLTNNLTTTDPLFVDASISNFYLKSTSPAINAGVNLSPTVTSYYDGTARVQSSTYVVGALGTSVATGDEIVDATAQLKIFPNPSDGRFTIETGTDQSVSLLIINAAGVPVHQQLLNNSKADVDLSGKPQGIYICRLQSGTKVLGVGKVIIR
ncbi:right-handed parallel beta-helix repeat-containing protein [Paludibacter sp.]|uniref:right-handed parallel beta-helix repeat-containing protein n=1 Tax=Paludibacter sp. TaxID=1898105 RepID=UPI0013541A54|nr:right-handed parallel beta-helix repeat-containing protein [Paludibacter sp.]MTK52418.1 T9SS type A sorting domain-containing protein [Paludibacter sp.]